MHDQVAANLRKQVQQSRREPRGRWAPELKARLIAYLEARHRDGVSYVRIAREVGVPFATIADWAQLVNKRRQESGFRRVEVREERAGLVVVHPSGVRVEGADAFAVAAIFKALS